MTDREVDIPNDSAMTLRTLVDFTSAVGNNFELRRPFVTMLGQMGSTGNSCKVEYQDVVCVFVGSAVPYEDNGIKYREYRALFYEDH